MTAVGVVGLGVMGRPMAERLLDAGHRVAVHSRSHGPVAELAARGALVAASPAELAAAAAITITVLPDPGTVEAVVLGAHGIAEGARSGSLYIDASTGPPDLARRIHRRLAARGVQALDAPVSGGESGARAGTLTVMAGGDAGALARAEPVLRALARRVTHVGGPGAGQIAKAANQVVVALTIQAVAEALALARAAGVDPARVREALAGGFADSRVLEEHGARMLAGDFRPGAALRLHAKDLAIARRLAAEHGFDAPATEAVAAAVEELLREGRGELDHSAIVTRYGGLA